MWSEMMSCDFVTTTTYAGSWNLPHKRPPSTKGGTYLTDCGIQYCSESSTHELYVLYLILILCITCLISVPPVFRFSAVSA